MVGTSDSWDLDISQDWLLLGIAHNMHGTDGRTDRRRPTNTADDRINVWTAMDRRPITHLAYCHHGQQSPGSHGV